MIKYVINVLIFIIVISACSPTKNEPVATPKPVATIRSQSSEDAIRVGVLAIRSAVAVNAQYGGIISYLEEELGQPFTLIPLTQEDQFRLVETGELEFTLNNPLAGVQIQRLYDTEFLATLSRRNTGPFFSGLIIVRTDSGIEAVADLKDVKGTCVAHQTAAAGCNFQVFHLQQQGIDPFTDFGSFTETPSQDNIVLGILNETFDVGFIRTGQLEKMLSEGTLLSLDDIQILDQADDDFFFPHTTILYPEWPFAALNDTNSELVMQVKQALLDMPEDHPALTEIGSNGFVFPVDYSDLNDLIVNLKLRSWDAE
jgi:two-component system, LuxR family, sensor histidine kinase TtrS